MSEINWEQKLDFYVKVSLSEEYYKYMADKWKYSKTENDPFAEPLKLFSNVSNGCGILLSDNTKLPVAKVFEMYGITQIQQCQEIKKLRRKFIPAQYKDRVFHSVSAILN